MKFLGFNNIICFLFGHFYGKKIYIDSWNNEYEGWYRYMASCKLCNSTKLKVERYKR